MTLAKQPEQRRVFSPEFKWQIVQQAEERSLSVSELARKYDVNTNQVFRWVREASIGDALWVKRVKGELEKPQAPMPFLPVITQPAEAPQTTPKPAITVSFRSGHQLMLHEATPGMLQHLVAALS
ncbi:transposase [Alkalimonas sp.]|uniref:transposase n=1 Tax=Alkalimonas sp. TaxID=1872453 RepID=UPI00263BC4F3|nr:transposase [Alkalimonas sp.]MCC5827775.1 transposase [Alkalimonas sp.]